MAKYDFDQLIPRRGTNSVKWDEEPAADILPMWVADMDFRTAPCVVEAPAAGWSTASTATPRSRELLRGGHVLVCPAARLGARSGLDTSRDGRDPGALGHSPGADPPRDRVLVLTPVYNHFFIAIDNSGCSAAECELTYGDNRYTVDFDALERRAADPAVKLMLLCNRTTRGAGLTPEELRRIGDICLRCDILVGPTKSTASW